MFLNNDVITQRVQKLVNSALKLIEQGIAEGKTDVALAYLKIVCPSSEPLDLQLPRLNQTVAQREQRDSAKENYSSTSPSDFSFWQSFKARLDLPHLDSDSSADVDVD